jgi:hypothetical protein
VFGTDSNYATLQGNSPYTPANLGLYGRFQNSNLFVSTGINESGDDACTIIATSSNGNNIDIQFEAAGDGVIDFQSPIATYNDISGKVSLSSGSATIYTPAVNSSSKILVSVGPLGTVTTPQIMQYDNVVDGVSFDIVSSDPTDTSEVSWFILA